MSTNTEKIHPAIFAYEPHWEAFDYEGLDVTDSAVALTPGTYLDAVRAEMTLETAQIRIRIDGTAPASDEGHPIEIGNVITLKSASQIANFKAIRTGGTSGKLKVTYFH